MQRVSDTDNAEPRISPKRGRQFESGRIDEAVDLSGNLAVDRDQRELHRRRGIGLLLFDRSGENVVGIWAIAGQQIATGDAERRQGEHEKALQKGPDYSVECITIDPLPNP